MKTIRRQRARKLERLKVTEARVLDVSGENLRVDIKSEAHRVFVRVHGDYVGTTAYYTETK